VSKNSKKQRTKAGRTKVTQQGRKEQARKYRATILVGEPFDDMSQPTRREICLDWLKRLARWLGGIAASAIVGKIIKKWLNIG